MTETMISTVTEQCPICGTVGYLRLEDTYQPGDRVPSHTDPASFNCPNACHPLRADLLAAFHKYRKQAPPTR